MIFISNLPVSPGPWHIDQINRGTVADSDGNRVAVVPKAKPGIKMYERRCADLAIIACAPELLAALKEAAFKLDEAGIPLNDDYYDLINRASHGVPELNAKNQKD